MAGRSKIGYFCAGLGAGTALAVLFAPKPGAETRGQLRAAADQGVDRLKDGARSAREALEHRDELVQAGKEHLKRAFESGRAAYRTSVNAHSAAETSTMGAIGVLALEAATVATGYQLLRGMGKQARSVAPRVEDLLDTSRAAVANTAIEIATVTSMVRRVLRQVQKILRARSPEFE
jgi:hypothetical protein